MLNQSSPLDLAFQALADPTRRAMVERLARSPASVSDLARPFSMSLPAVMQHLAGLKLRARRFGEGRGRQDVPGRAAGVECARAMDQRPSDRVGTPARSAGLLPRNPQKGRRRRRWPARLKSSPRSTPVTRPEPLVVSRHFPVPRDLVFKAWSSAEHIKRWFSPEGCSVPEAEIEFRAGGVFAVQMRLHSGEDHWIRGAFDEVLPPDRLVFTAGVTSGGGNASPCTPPSPSRTTAWAPG